MIIHVESHNSHLYFKYKGPLYPRDLVLKKIFEINLLKIGDKIL